jgi:tRNA-Thr(GGU) m(6)t(6)A37 methyltransferase TsaA
MVNTPRPEPATLTLRPIGIVHSPFKERSSAPRQAAASAGALGQLELFQHSSVEHALLDLDSFRFIWVLFWFHQNEGYKPKVLPPRSSKRRGVFATRSPYRPNPIGLSAVELLGIRGRLLDVRNLDILDQTPILDLKPYLPYADCIPHANSGWLEHESPLDPLPNYQVEFTPEALAQLDFLARRGVQLRQPVEQMLALGPEPHPYRRIKQTPSGYRLAHKEWRFEFVAQELRITVTAVHTGYRASALSDPATPGIDVHRAFVERFGSQP